ncbi:MAG TPA: DUF859 family phage minor structural protein [Sideroxyarcus sp.]|nr:DUF859 family phage minor structural protein [Sideroxyarcus sp.]
MATYTDTFSARTQYELALTVTESSTDSANNRSTVDWSLVARVRSGQSNPGSWNNFNDSNWAVTVNGVSWSGTYNYDFRSASSVSIASDSLTVTHNSDGSKTISASASADGGTGTIGSASTSGSLALTDFSRPPSAPGAPTLSRSSDGKTVTVTSPIPSSSVTITGYRYQYSTNGSTWLGPVNMTGTSRVASFGPTSPITVSATQQYWFRTAATSTEGWGNYGTSASIVGVPTAPATINVTRNARDVSVTAGNSTGTGITGYSVQYSSDSGSTWSTAVAMTAQAYTYTGLTAGLTYLFRVYSTNSIGNSDPTTSAATFVPAGGKRWDGSGWQATSTAKRYAPGEPGADPVTGWKDIAIAKRWNGTGWVDLS